MTVRRGLAILVAGLLVVAVVAGGWLAWNFAQAGPGACATALMQGTLVEHEGTLGVANPELRGGAPSVVDWPFGYAVERRDGELVLTRVFTIVAREGDAVSMGGGFTDADDRFEGCGPITLGLLNPPEVPPPVQGARLTIIGTAFEPCIPPPSGCGYAVTLTSPAGGAARADLSHTRSFESAAAGTETPLALGPDIPTRLAPGDYVLAFELEEYSDVATPVVDASGNETYPPRTWVGCEWAFTVPADAASHSYTVSVTYRGIECTTEWAVGVAN